MVTSRDGLPHGRRSTFFTGLQGDGNQIGALATGGDRGQQTGGHGIEPAELHDAASPRAGEGQQPGPGAVPVSCAEHDPDNAAVTLIYLGDQPLQLDGWVI